MKGVKCFCVFSMGSAAETKIGLESFVRVLIESRKEEKEGARERKKRKIKRERKMSKKKKRNGKESEHEKYHWIIDH